MAHKTIVKRVQAIDSASAAEFVPRSHDLNVLAAASKGCRGCDLYLRGTQTVFGEGSRRARLMLVGEQPGDKEDLTGKPFVGPAGALLDRALAEAGIERKQVYVTNAVKHFKWEARGKRRIHEKPSAREIAACRPWLEAELDAVRPELVVCLGASAAQSVIGKSFKVTKQRGEMIDAASLKVPLEHALWVSATVHPSAILRAPDNEARHREYALFVADLRNFAKVLAHSQEEKRAA